MRLVLIAMLAAAAMSAADLRCNACHVEGKSFDRSPMTRTLKAGGELGLKAELKTVKAGYEYRLFRDGARLWYEVRRGSERLRLPVDWVFGTGRTGQTFVFSRDGRFYESRVSYYPKLVGLDLTIGAANSEPVDLTEAAGRLMSKADIKDCFGCHSSSPRGAGGGVPEALTPGVQCERCHGASEGHPAEGHPAKAVIRSLKKATTEEITTLCGECHRTWEQVKLLNLRGVSTVRFQPFRLSQSKCYDLIDRRISCTACHDPHQPQIISQERVDRACLACHSASPCPKAKAACAGCHMPKYELPGAHAEFSDHRIRVVRANEKFPD